MTDCDAALALRPSDGDTLESCYRTLGYAYAYLKDYAQAKRYLYLYRPDAGFNRPELR